MTERNLFTANSGPLTTTTTAPLEQAPGRAPSEQDQPSTTRNAPQPNSYEIPTADLEHLTGPRNYPEPCPWCGGRLVHHPRCNELRQCWEITMPFGKHRGKPLSQIPAEYLAWLVENGNKLEPELLTAIQTRLEQTR